MSPDLSNDRELVECAKVLLEAWLGQRDKLQWERWLAVADAARTFFGSGFLLEATEENAERLARESEPKMQFEVCMAVDGNHCCSLPHGHSGPHNTPAKPKPRDITADAERRKERQKLVLDFALSFAGRLDYENEEPMDSNWRAVLRVATTYADGYLAWRDADDAAARERICKK